MRFVFNLEETISFNGKIVSPYLTEMLTFLAEQGHETIFVSSKSIRDMMALLNKRFHHNKLIGGNGAVICYRGNVEQIVAFSTALFTQLKEIILKYDATYLIESDWDYAYTGGAYHRIINFVDPFKLAENLPIDAIPNAWKITILSASNRQGMIKELHTLKINMKLIDDGEMIEMTPPGLNKWNSLRTLGVQKRNYVVFGRDDDDVSMFDHAQYTVLIGKNPMLQQYADEVVEIDERIEPKIVETCKKLSVKYAVR
ncbi:HAD hydrolase family protein [Kurthia sibirica]|uniref:HAD family hydrolase n=1 Tax=Kurthia sibirica TaxID=202750 RepID=A0A2U3AH59_9BACL|nr:HAD hydrolase family protein [Kurthia sibirica]PWI23879.1 hypothetical protein DEX24_15540 [Kurthia sibirica]GEK35046.1 hydrolase [Kurthia sibirica]